MRREAGEPASRLAPPEGGVGPQCRPRLVALKSFLGSGMARSKGFAGAGGGGIFGGFGVQGGSGT